MERRLLVISISLLALGCLSGGTAPEGEVADATTLAGEPSKPARDRRETMIADVTTSLTQAFGRFRREDVVVLAPVIVDSAASAGLDPALVVAVIQVESSGDRYAISRVGALGLMQLRPTTGEAVARRLGIHWHGPAMLFDPVSNVRIGVAYLGSLLHRFGDLPTALAAYNEGPTRVSHRLRHGKRAPAGYSQRVLARFGKSVGRERMADAV